ncbi:stamen-specific protein FIL1 [Daucus carota subsp. sativus]|uniref:stamen-specific protein FIL1 n=1 Tax=Daucus carota subsp. sativus TaxID=79200 RepID=UPI0007EEF93B|nr:PREDICTED: stamen-specific protein FIL1-like [Daucus carota subsp. sativus]
MGASTKSVVSRNTGIKMVLAVAMIALFLQISDHQVQAQGPNCSGTLSSLNTCAPFVVPGANNSPSPECCSALQSVDHDCYCNTLRIAAQIPTHCNLPPLSCAVN